MNAWACIAARNEAATIAALVAGLQRMGLTVSVADDGSTDGTAHAARAAGALVVYHAHSRGIAAAVMASWRAALDLGASRLVQMDAGGSHRPNDALRLLAVEADVVVGSRFRRDSAYVGRRWRALLSRLAALACNLRTGYRVSDWTSGYRAYSAEAARYLLGAGGYEARMHGWQIEVLGRALRGGLSVGEAPINYVAGDSTFGWRAALEAAYVWRCL